MSVTESRKELKMDENVNVNLNNKFTNSEMNQYRSTLAIFGKWYGHKIICPISDNADLMHKDKVKNSINPRLANPIKKFYTKTFDMINFKLTKDANGKAVIIINDDPKLTYPLIGKEKPKFIECTPELVNEALLRYEQTKELTFFTDYENVVAVITQLNEQNAKDADEFADSLMNIASTLRQTNKLETQQKEEYYKSLDL